MKINSFTSEPWRPNKILSNCNNRRSAAQKQRKSLFATSRQRNGLCPIMTFCSLALKHQHNAVMLNVQWWHFAACSETSTQAGKAFGSGCRFPWWESQLCQKSGDLSFSLSNSKFIWIFFERNARKLLMAIESYNVILFKLCNWIREDYDQCIKPFVHCGFHQGDLLV